MPAALTPEQQVATQYKVVVLSNGDMTCNGLPVIYKTLPIVAHRPSHEFPEGFRCQWMLNSCTQCPDSSDSPTTFSNHLMIKHASTTAPELNWFCCRYSGCTKHFNTYSKFVRHVETHAGIKGFKCPINTCATDFSSMQSLKSHVKRHTDEKDFVCKKAGCTYKTGAKFQLDQHISRVHRKDQRFLCSTCHTRFGDRSNWNKHMKTCQISSQKSRSATPKTESSSASTPMHPGWPSASWVEQPHGNGAASYMSTFNDVDAVPTYMSTFNGVDAVPTYMSTFNDVDAVPTYMSTFNGVDAVPTYMSTFNDMEAVPTYVPNSHSGKSFAARRIQIPQGMIKEYTLNVPELRLWWKEPFV